MLWGRFFRLFYTTLLNEYRDMARVVSLLSFSWMLVYLIFRVLPDYNIGQFSAFYWILLLIVSINACLRAEAHHNEEEMLFLYTLHHPIEFYISKLLFNFIYTGIIGFALYIFHTIYFTHTIVWSLDYVALIILGAWSLSSCLSFVATIGGQLKGANALVSLISLPLLIPVILILQSITAEIFMIGDVELSKILSLLSVSLLTLGLGVILFPTLWRQ